MHPLAEESFLWRGNNFPELYEWLTRRSITKSFKIKVIEPGQPNSSVEIVIDNIWLVLEIEDLIVRTEEDIYYVLK